MDSKEAVFLIEKLRKYITVELNLSDIQEFVWHRCLMGLSYQEIADRSGYDHDYIKQTGAKLWRSLSAVLDKKVTKSNIRNVLNQYCQEQEQISLDSLLIESGTTKQESICDWGDAIDVSSFLGRKKELDLAKNWILQSGSRSLAVLGMGGIGKTAFTSKLARDIAKEFQYVIWRNLRNAPPFNELLVDFISLVAKQKLTHSRQPPSERPRAESPKGILLSGRTELSLTLPDAIDSRLDLLMHYLSTSGCLIVLDNVESILRSCQTGGRYRQNYEGYGQLLRRVADEKHQSRLIVTSRERPIGISFRQGKNSPVFNLQLEGLSLQEGQKILADKKTSIDLNAASNLVRVYSGNPLALKIASATINSLFNGNINEFLDRGSIVFGDIWDLIEQQFDRLTELERQIVYWLAIARVPQSILQLSQNLVEKLSSRVLLRVLESLQGRSLIKIASKGYTLEVMIMEYVTERLIGQIHQEIITQQLELLLQLPLIQAKSCDRVRKAQTRSILNSIVKSLSIATKKKSNLEQLLYDLLDRLRGQSFIEAGYGVGNILNLLGQLDSDLRGKDFSNLSIWQAYLPQTILNRANFAHSNFRQSRFAETFGSVTCVSFSADGRLLATGHTSGKMNVWSIDSDKQIISLKGKAFWIWAFVFSPNGKILASAGDDSAVSLWDAHTGRCLATLEGDSSHINTLVFTADNNFLLSAGLDKTIKIWDIRHINNPTAENRLDSYNYKNTYTRSLTGHSDRVWHIALSPDGHTVASASEDTTVKLWDLNTGECLQTLRGHQHWVWSVNFGNSGKWLVSSSSDRTIKLWDVATGKCLTTFCGHQGRVTGVNPSPDERHLISSSSDRTIKLWDIATGKCLTTFCGHQDRIWSISLSPDGRILASGGDNNTIKLWDTKTGECLKSLEGYADATQEIDLSPDGRILASGHDDRTIKLWDLKTGKICHTLCGHSSRIWSIVFAPFYRDRSQTKEPKLLASGSFDHTIKIWNWETAECLHALKGHLSWVLRVAFSPDAKLLASSSYDRTIKLWDVATGRCLKTFIGHQGAVAWIEFSPNGQKLASSSYDRTIKLWDVATGKCLKTFVGHTDNVCAVTFSPDAKLLASSSYDRTIKLWDVATGRCLKTLIGHNEPITKVAFDRKGERLTSSSYDRTIKLWDIATGRCIKTLIGHTDIVSGLIFDRFIDSELEFSQPSTLISSSYDRTIKFWNLETGECSYTLQAPRLYENMNIKGIKGLTSAEKSTLRSLGAIE